MNKDYINKFLVETFNELTKFEETAMANKRLSMKEIHIIEAVVKAEKEKTSTLGNIAKILSVTPGTISVAMKTLVRKGFFIREQDQTDKRVVKFTPTRIALYVNKQHAFFHQGMIDEIMSLTTEEEQELLTKTLLKIKNYFQEKAKTTD